MPVTWRPGYGGQPGYVPPGQNPYAPYVTQTYYPGLGGDPAHPTGNEPTGPVYTPPTGNPGGAQDPSHPGAGGSPVYVPPPNAPGAPAGPPAPPVAPPPAPKFDPMNDSWYTGLHQQYLTDMANQKTTALESQRRLLQQLGDVNLAKAPLGAADPFLASISADPNASTSQLAQLARAYGQNQSNTNASLNKSNLFFSGARGKQLRNLAQDYMTGQGTARADATEKLAAIGTALTNYMTNTYAPEEATALREAQARWLAAQGVTA